MQRSLIIYFQINLCMFLEIQSINLKKPHPCLVQLAMQLMESNKNETLMIGDSNVDIETAINAKIKSIGCEWGFRGKEELVQAGATYTVSKPSDIKELLK